MSKSSPWQTHYIGHDRQYARRKEEGRPGWNTAEETQELWDILEAEFAASYIPRSGKALEMGCGAGDNTLWLAGHGYTAHGIDIAPSAIAWAKEKASARGLQADFTVGDVCHLDPYPDDTFDLVLDGCCLHCIIGEDRRPFLSEAYRVLKPGGIFLSLTLCNDPVSPGLRQNFDIATRCQVYGNIAIRYCGLPEKILEEIRAPGFVLIHHIRTAPTQHSDDLLITAATKPAP